MENQTFFTKSKILEKAVNQVQGDALCKAVIQRQKINCHSEFDSESILYKSHTQLQKKTARHSELDSESIKK